MKRIICNIFGHNVIKIKSGKLMKNWDLIYCKRCKRKYILNHDMRDMLESDRELEASMDGEFI